MTFDELGIVMFIVMFAVLPLVMLFVIALPFILPDRSRKDRSFSKKSGKDNRDYSKCKRLCKRLSRVTDESRYPNDPEMLRCMSTIFSLDHHDKERALICLKKAYALGSTKSGDDVANSLLLYGDDSVATLREAEQYASSKIVINEVQRALELRLGVDACEEKQWEKALPHLRKAVDMKLDRADDVKRAGRCCYYAAMAQMECAQNFREWQWAYLLTFRTGLERSGYADKLKELRKQIFSRGSAHLQPVMELLSRAKEYEDACDFKTAWDLYEKAAINGSCAAECRKGMIYARFAMSMEDIEQAKWFVQKGIDLGYPHRREVLEFIERREPWVRTLENFLQNEKLDYHFTEMTKSKMQDGLSLIEYARLRVFRANKYSDWKDIMEYLQRAVDAGCTEQKAVKQWIDMLREKMDMYINLGQQGVEGLVEQIDETFRSDYILGTREAPYGSAECFFHRAASERYQVTGNHINDFLRLGSFTMLIQQANILTLMNIVLQTSEVAVNNLWKWNKEIFALLKHRGSYYEYLYGSDS